MKSKMFLYTLALFLVLGIFASITQIFAQDGINDGTATSPGAGAVIDNTGATTADGFSLIWLLPVIALPLLVYLLLIKRRGRSSIDEGFDGDLAGAKGGIAKSDDYEDYYDQDQGQVVKREKFL